jgi:hypothetical protein
MTDEHFLFLLGGALSVLCKKFSTSWKYKIISDDFWTTMDLLAKQKQIKKPFVAVFPRGSDLVL